MKFTNIERLLPFGYLILVVLGILKESVFYHQIGINILKYSSIMDVLISPISDLTASPLILIALLFFVTLIFLMFWYASKNTDKKWAKKFINKNYQSEKLTVTEMQTQMANKFLAVILICVMNFFLGIGIGGGRKVSEKIAKNNLTYNHLVTFNTGETKLIYLIGSNNSNIFYIEKGNKNVKISPIGVIKAIELIKK